MNLVVDLISDQTIDGVKTFTKPPVVPAGSFHQTAVAGLVADLAAKQETIPPDTYVVTTGDSSKAGNLQLTGDSGLTFPTSIGSLVHGVHRTQAGFNGVVDDVLNVGLNISPGVAGTKGVATESFLQLGLEQHWAGPRGEHFTEYNLDYQSPDRSHVFRPMGWYADRVTHDNGWSFRGTHWHYSSDTVEEVFKLTNAGVKLHGFDLRGRALSGAGFDWPTVQSRNASAPTEFSVMPKGAPAGERSALVAYGSDLAADSINYQRLAIYAWSDGAADLVTEKGGTGVAGSIFMHATRKIEFKPDGKIIMGNKLTLAGQSSGSVEVIDNSGSAYFTRLNAQNGIFRMFSGTHLSILDVSNTAGIDLHHDGTAAAFNTFTVTPISLRIRAVEHARISSGGDGDTALMLRRNVGGTFTLQRVSMGPADSGGAGFRVLRVPN